MPSIVLLMRSRLRMRPRSFSMRMPRSSSYCRLILRRPASSLGRSSCPSSARSSSPSKMLNPFDLDPGALSVLRARALRCSILRSVRSLGIAAVLVADPEEAPGAVARELDDSALGAAGRAQSFAPGLATLLRRLGLLLCHWGAARKKIARGEA